MTSLCVPECPIQAIWPLDELPDVYSEWVEKNGGKSAPTPKAAAEGAELLRDKCPGFLGKTEWNIGHVATGLSTRYDGLVNINPQRLCGSCSHRPECAGGCVAAAWTASGRTEGVDCEIGFYEQHGEAIVKRRYALAVSESPEAALALFPPSARLPERPQTRGRSSALRVIAA